MPSIISPGIGSGLDVNSLVLQLVAAEGTPTALRLDRQEAGVQAELSAYGTLNAAMDKFRTTLERFADLDTFQGRIATSGDKERFTVSATKDANPGEYDVEVLALAQGQKLTSAAFVDSETTVGSGTLTFAAGTGEDANSFSITVPKEASSLADIRDAINDAEDNFGVSATIVNGEDGSHLVLTTADTGESSSLTITASNDDGALAPLVYDVAGGTANMTQTVEPQNARIEVDGFLVISETNTITSAIQGVTINLVSAEPGDKSTLGVRYDTAGASQAVSDFVDAYNDVVSTISSLSSYDPETQVGGTLLGDATLRSVASALSREIGTATSGSGSDFKFLSELGISTQIDGKLELDADALNERLSEDFNAVGRLFASEGGYADRLDAALGIFIDDGGQLDNRTEGLKLQVEDITQQREDLDRRLDSLEARYRQQFTALDSLISSLTATSDFLATQLAAIPVPTSGN